MMVDKRVVRQGYEAIATTYADHRSPDETDRAMLEAFFAETDAEGLVLDAGCGDGWVVEAFDTPNRPLIGLDAARSGLELAAQGRDAPALLQGDLTTIPLRAETCVAVVALHSVIHVPLAAHADVIQEFARVLVPGGRLLLTEGDREWAGTNPDWLDSGVEMQWSIAGADRTRTQLRDVGFEILDERTAVDALAEDDSTWRYFIAELD